MSEVINLEYGLEQGSFTDSSCYTAPFRGGDTGGVQDAGTGYYNNTGRIARLNEGGYSRCRFHFNLNSVFVYVLYSTGGASYISSECKAPDIPIRKKRAGGRYRALVIYTGCLGQSINSLSLCHNLAVFLPEMASIYPRFWLIRCPYGSAMFISLRQMPF